MPRYRLELTKEEEIRYISHLDYATLLERAISRAKLPATYSEGFNPHMKISFASALALGVTSSEEYMDVELSEELPLEEVKARLQKVLPRGVNILRVKLLQGKTKALMSLVDEANYEITLPLLGDVLEVADALAKFNTAKEIFFLRVTPKKKREIDIKEYILGDVEKDVKNKRELFLFLTLKITMTGSVKPIEVLEVLVKDYHLPVAFEKAKIHRTRLLSRKRDLLHVAD